MFVMQRSPVDYSKCNQTVTVYHAENGAYTSTVYRRAFLDFRKNQNINKTGSTESNGFLLVIPAGTVIPTDKPIVFVGDKVLLGEGAPVNTREDWAKLIPANVPGLVVIKYVDPKYWQGQMVHVEAGG